MLAFGLIHSPLVGPATWQPVAEALRQRGAAVAVPQVAALPGSPRPYWQQHAESAAAGLRRLPARPVLVAHSGAGALLPAIRRSLDQPAAAYLFVDAGLPAAGSRLANFGDAAMAAGLRQHLGAGGRWPEWTDEQLRVVVPDDTRRARLLAGLQPQPLAFWDEPLPAPAGWPDAPCGYLRFSPVYAADAERARSLGWPVRAIDAGHFHMLVDPAAVAETLWDMAQGLLSGAA